MYPGRVLSTSTNPEFEYCTFGYFSSFGFRKM
jgi:hypothetical protein